MDLHKKYYNNNISNSVSSSFSSSGKKNYALIYLSVGDWRRMKNSISSGEEIQGKFYIVPLKACVRFSIIFCTFDIF